MEKSASKNLTQNKFVTLSNGKTRGSYQKTYNVGRGQGSLMTWQEGLSVESRRLNQGGSSHGNVIRKYESNYKFIIAKKAFLSLHASDKKQNHVPSFLALLLHSAIDPLINLLDPSCKLSVIKILLN